MSPRQNGSGNGSNGTSVQNIVVLASLLVAVLGPAYIMLQNYDDRIRSAEHRAEEEYRKIYSLIDQRKRTAEGVLEELARIKERSRETETQFTAAAEKADAESERVHSTLQLLWNKVYAEPLPDRRVFPGFHGKKFPSAASNGNGH